MLEKAVQSAIYEKALKNHYIEILYIDFEDTGKCIKLHQDTKLLSGENIFPESDEQMFDDYICEKIMRYASGDTEDLNWVKQQMTMEAITQGTAEHVMHHVMINFMLNGEMRFMQFEFARESEDTKNVFLFVEDYTDPQQQMMLLQKNEELSNALRYTKKRDKEKFTMQDSIIRTLVAPYENAYVVDIHSGTTTCYSMGEAMLERYGEEFFNGDYEKKISYYIENDVLEEDRKLFDQIRSLKNIEKLLAERNNYSLNYRVFRNNEIKYYQCYLARLNKECNQFIVAFKSIDEEKKQEEILNKALIEAKVASKAKTDFLFNMSHDIRTPMNAIIGFTNLLEEHLDDKEILLNYIDKIKTANEFLLSLINNVLEMAKIENGKEHLDEANTNMVDFYHTIVTLFHTQMNEKGVIFRHSLKIRHRNVMIDVTKMREILLNILSNALKYTPTGNSVTMTVTELPSEREGYAVYQTIIEDTGIGMSEEFLSHMFEYFSRERTTTESGVSGTGLGTAIVKKLVDLMHGTIDVESKLGEGTKITLKMSHQITENQDVQQNFQNEREYNTRDFTGKRILLAEDNDLNAEIAIAILEEQGLEVERAEDGIVCVNMIEKADADHYDLVLMDIQMPNMDGYKATQLIRQLPDKKKSRVPVIAMTANAFEEDKRNALVAGMDGFLSKPIVIEELLYTLQNTMEVK